MALDNDNLNVFSIGIPSDKTLEECLDEGMSFKEANEEMKTKFVEVNVSNGLTVYERKRQKLWKK